MKKILIILGFLALSLTSYSQISLAQVLSWFETGDKPTQQQYEDAWTYSYNTVIDGVWDLSGGSSIQVNAFAAKSAGKFYSGTTNPTDTANRINYDGIIYASKLYSQGVLVGGGGSSYWTKVGNYLYPTTTDSVAIGAVTPLAKLYVNGDFRTTSSGIIPEIVFHSSGDPDDGLIYGATDNLTFYDGTVGTKTLDQLVNITTDTSLWTLTGTDIYNKNADDVGIGTATPSAKLDVVGTTEFNGNSTINGDLTLNGSPALLTINGNIINNGAGYFASLYDATFANTWGGAFLGTTINEYSIDGTLGGNSDNAVPTEKAVKTYVDNVASPWIISGSDLYTTIYDVQVGTTTPINSAKFSVVGDIFSDNMQYNITMYNSYIGYQAGANSGINANNDNTFVGYRSGYENEGDYNTFVGSKAGYSASSATGSSSVGVGHSALYELSSGANNIGVGNSAGYSITSGSDNIFIGLNAGALTTATSSNIAIGSYSQSILDGGLNNVSIGEKAGRYLNGQNNVAIGFESGSSYAPSAGNYNTFLGNKAGLSSTGNNNTAIGSESALNMTGANNTFLGYKAGLNVTTGSSNVMLGNEAGGTSNVSNSLYIDNSNTTTPLIFGKFDNDSLVINGYLRLNGATNIGGGAGLTGLNQGANRLTYYKGTADTILGSASLTFNSGTNTLTTTNIDATAHIDLSGVAGYLQFNNSNNRISRTSGTDEIDVMAGGFNIAKFAYGGGTAEQLILDPDGALTGDADYPNLAFGSSANTGFFDGGVGLSVTLSGSQDWIFKYTPKIFGSVDGDGPGLFDVTGTRTAPTILPKNLYTTTGLGGNDNEISSIISGVEKIRVTADSVVIYDVLKGRDAIVAGDIDNLSNSFFVFGNYPSIGSELFQVNIGQTASNNYGSIALEQDNLLMEASDYSGAENRRSYFNVGDEYIDLGHNSSLYQDYTLDIFNNDTALLLYTSDGGNETMLVFDPQAESTSEVAYLFDTENSLTSSKILSINNNSTEKLAIYNDSIEIAPPLVLDTNTVSGFHEGMIWYDFDTKALTLKNDIADASHNIGYEFFRRVYNNSGGTILNGRLVRRTGTYANGERVATVAYAGNSTEDSANVFGMATVDIANNSYGLVTLFGDVKGLNTSALSEDRTYLGNLGQPIDTSPPPPALSVCVGEVLYSDNDSGIIAMNPRDPTFDPAPLFSADTSRLNQDVIITGSGEFEYIPLSAIGVINTNFGFTVQGDSIQAQVAGIYEAVLSYSMQGNATSETWRYGPFKNGVEVWTKTRTTSSSNNGDANVPKKITLTTSDWLSWKIANESGAGDPTIVDLSIELIFLSTE
jgi:hypothetical protein